MPRCPVVQDVAVFASRSMARAFALELGFHREAAEEVVVVVSELASNILKYGRRGAIELAPISDPHRGAGLSIIAEDETGVFDLESAVRDGHDAVGKLDPALVYGRRGIGAGLGAVVRLSDGIELVALERGKRIVVRRFAKRAMRHSSPSF
jgi:anti-sigma regulatory factor (Ser/Thr protein kinase)